MKIGIDGRAAKWYRGTGIGTYTYELINHINRLDKINNYTIFLPDPLNLNFEFKNNFNLKSIDYKAKNNFWDQVNIPNIITKNDTELYHVPQNGIGLPHNKSCRFTITLHDIIPYKMPETVGKKYLKIFTEQIQKIIPLCDGIITVSNFSKHDISKFFNYPENNIYVTYLSAENIYKPIDKALSKKIIKTVYGINNDYILYVGGFSPRKNILGIIEAFSKLKKSIKSNLKLIIAGKKGQSYLSYVDIANKLNISSDVIFPGFVTLEYMPFLYNAAEFLIYPSFYEGFGLPPLEAMACKLPVITSNTTSLYEIFKDCAFTVNPYDIEDIKNAMELMYSDNRTRAIFSEKGFNFSKKLTWNDTTISTIAAYKKISKN
ncbi:glycosyltransferase family 4 protein [Clostridium felsineum]|uniref:D-inositol-3-phosphate glycosyltransferase n=1 Tax=Clostridium felsineum TaxID=36839 RepID=A0A1S8KX21_9CLOT|nr:glycosyltransferase family 1 protein [Clostridium felsineum]URZ07986.1 D-inositol-3-phosphate glycosyltransferase [Clostridium felsineum]URZ13017.1 D-inositol-3-phosphate glycosyltransferase [Clostridium felsineum]